LQCALLDLLSTPLYLHHAPLEQQCVSLDRQRVSLGLLHVLISLQRAPRELRQVLLEMEHLQPDLPRAPLGLRRVSPGTARVSHDWQRFCAARRSYWCACNYFFGLKAMSTVYSIVLRT
jgi:hypothetical protein